MLARGGTLISKSAGEQILVCGRRAWQVDDDVNDEQGASWAAPPPPPPDPSISPPVGRGKQR